MENQRVLGGGLMGIFQVNPNVYSTLKIRVGWKLNTEYKLVQSPRV